MFGSRSAACNSKAQLFGTNSDLFSYVKFFETSFFNQIRYMLLKLFLFLHVSLHPVKFMIVK